MGRSLHGHVMLCTNASMKNSTVLELVKKHGVSLTINKVISNDTASFKPSRGAYKQRIEKVKKKQFEKLNKSKRKEEIRRELEASTCISRVRLYFLKEEGCTTSSTNTVQHQHNHHYHHHHHHKHHYHHHHSLFFHRFSNK